MIFLCVILFVCLLVVVKMANMDSYNNLKNEKSKGEMLLLKLG